MSAYALPSPAPLSFRLPVLPWATASIDDARYRRILRTTLAAALLLGTVLPFVPLRPLPHIETQPLPPPLARLLIERAPNPTPRPTPAPVRAAPEAATQAAQPSKPTPTATASPSRAPVPEARRPIEGRPPGEADLERARRRASGVGLLAMKDEIAAAAGAPMAVQLRADIRPGPGVGSGTGPGVGAGHDPGLPLRSMIVAAATRGSGGIGNAAASLDSGGGGLAGRSTTLVAGVAGGGGGGGPGSRSGSGIGNGNGNGGSGGGNGAGGAGRRSAATAQRSLEDIKLVFERHKGAIYALYNRALRDDPTLQGKVVLELTIAPGGSVDALRIVSTELHADDLEHRLLARVRGFDFGAKDVATMVVTWPLDFLPS
ncbi:MAG: AgmX/PglI C-terminal domain-containing protein [Burkholderiales bacterium]|nr:AgmX/PglI C-terminal domain-containing protein [Burkholderiales bacterium]